MSEMSATDWITLAIAILGAVTGVYGTLIAHKTHTKQLEDDKVSLKVSAEWGMRTDEPDDRFLSVTAVNLSKFPVTISQVGLLVDNDHRLAIDINATDNRGRRLPIRLDARERFSLNFTPDFLRNPEFRDARCAVAHTACGVRVESPPDVVPRMMEAAQG